MCCCDNFAVIRIEDRYFPVEKTKIAIVMMIVEAAHGDLACGLTVRDCDNMTILALCQAEGGLLVSQCVESLVCVLAVSNVFIIYDYNGAGGLLVLVGAGLHGAGWKQGGSLKKITSQILNVEPEFSVSRGRWELNINPIDSPLIFSKLG